MTDKTRKGRPRKSAAASFPVEEVDRLLVFGEQVEATDGTATLSFPSYRAIAERFGVSHTLIARYAKSHDCLGRRERAQNRVEARVEHKMVEARATAQAYAVEDEMRLIDTYLAGFERALLEGRVRMDNPTDFNTMIRLKRFIQGGADSRREVDTRINLAAIAVLHQQTLQAERQIALAGGVVDRKKEVIDADYDEVSADG